MNAGSVINSYKTVFGITDEKAKEMYLLTNGYPFAFQVLGYLCWAKGGADALEQILPVYDQYLDEYVYSKIWSELSDNDKRIMKTISETDVNDVTEIRNKLDMSTEMFSVYRKRLIHKGLIIPDGYGKVREVLPRFDVFCNTQI